MLNRNKGNQDGLRTQKKQERNSRKNSNVFSSVFDESIQKGPQFTRIKNNLLLLIMVLSAYGVYFLIGNFIDIILTAFLAGIAYIHSKERFKNLIVKQKKDKKNKQLFIIRLLKSFLLGIFGFVLPRLRYILGHPQKITRLPKYRELLVSLKQTRNMVIIGCQLFIVILIIYYLLGDFIYKMASKLKTNNEKILNSTFFCFVFTGVLLTFIIFPFLLIRQVNSIGYMVEKKIQQNLNCQIISFEENKQLPFCTDKIIAQNELVKQALHQFKNQNQTIQGCVNYLRKTQKQYMLTKYIRKKKMRHYNQILCTWYSFLEKAIKYSGIQSVQSMMSSGANIFKMIFGSLAIIIQSFSSFIFSFTTFLATFYLTTQYFQSSQKVLKNLFTEQKQALITSIAALIQATLLIVFQHFVLSIIVLEIFNYTNINLMLATLLSSMAFFPFFRPWFGALIAAIIRMIVLDEYKVSLLFVFMYYFISENIYSRHYEKMGIHEIIVNMSVLFGIYQFGIVGIFYGPLIIIVYKCVENEILGIKTEEEMH